MVSQRDRWSQRETHVERTLDGWQPIKTGYVLELLLRNVCLSG